jgi:hypothetical protein
MLIEKEDPFEKSTPEACKTAFPAKLRAPEGSLADPIDVRIILRIADRDYLHYFRKVGKRGTRHGRSFRRVRP